MKQATIRAKALAALTRSGYLGQKEKRNLGFGEAVELAHSRRANVKKGLPRAGRILSRPQDHTAPVVYPSTRSNYSPYNPYGSGTSSGSSAGRVPAPFAIRTIHIAAANKTSSPHDSIRTADDLSTSATSLLDLTTEEQVTLLDGIANKMGLSGTPEHKRLQVLREAFAEAGSIGKEALRTVYDSLCDRGLCDSH